MMIEKEFIPYEEALALKELEFDEEVCGYFSKKNKLSIVTPEYRDVIKLLKAPLLSQAFRWFRNHESIRDLNVFKSSYNYSYRIQTENPYTQTSEMGFNSYEEAELECLRKLIEIVK